VLFAAAYLLQAQRLFAGYPDWQLYLQLGFLLLAVGFAIYQLVTTILARRQVKFLRDANVAIGHQLQQISSGITQIFHDVATSAGVVDHVVIGQSGLYAINVVAKRARKGGSVQLQGNELHFSTSKLPQSIVGIAARTARLEKEFHNLLGHRVRVRSVIAAPGWKIGEQASQDHLLVNERNIAMLRGWKDETDHQMNEDVEALVQELTNQCLCTPKVAVS